MNKLLILLSSIALIGCLDKEEQRYSIYNYSGEVVYSNTGDSLDLHLQFYSLDFKDYCEITLTGEVGTKKYHSESERYGFPYILKNSDLSTIIPLSYRFQWDPKQLAYYMLEGSSTDGSIRAKLTKDDYEYVNNTGSHSSSQRCQATTQAGSQCKRTASEGSIYCWQHK